jgi:hypothetical protein
MRVGRKLSRLIGFLLALALWPGAIARADSAPVSPAAGSITQPAESTPTGSSAAPESTPVPPVPRSAGPSGSNPGVAGPMPANAPESFSLLNPHSWPFSFIPVPEIATDPNQGTTAGLLPIFLFTDDHHQISSILAPDINDNTIIGAGGNFRYLAYPSEDTQWYFTAGAAQNIARSVDMFYSTGRTHSELWSLEGRFYYERDPTERFFGIGNQTPHGGQSNYTTEQAYGLVTATLNLTKRLQLSLVEKPRYVRIHRGALENLPSIFKLYPNVKGINGGSDIKNRLMLSYDTRDSPDIPRQGGLLRFFTGLSDRRFMSSVSYWQIGGEARGYASFGSRFTLAGHVFLQYTPAGNETPFWAMGRLGGEDSLLTDQETLRGYGAGRFVDNNLSVANVELRSRVYEMDLFGTHGIIELAPFVEAGKVFHTMRDNPVDQLHPVGGLGVRGIAEPFVVGYVDVGVGGEGGTIFSGINYPF